jgi:DNA-binding transcriptional MerR regulator
MFKIGEFSQMGQVTIRTLRHYDDLGLLKPAYIDPESDYRYYALEQLPRLNRIIALKELGLTLEQIATLLDGEVTAEQLRGMLAQRQAEIAQEIAATQAQMERVAARLRMIEQEGKVSPYEVARKVVPAQTVATIRQMVPTLAEMKHYRCTLYPELYDWLERRNISLAGPEFALYHNEEFTEQDIDMEVGVIVPASALGASTGRVSIYELPAEPAMASVTYQGSLWEVIQPICALFAWMGTNGYTASGPYREIHLFGREDALFSKDDLVIEVQLPIVSRSVAEIPPKTP